MIRFDIFFVKIKNFIKNNTIWSIIIAVIIIVFCYFSYSWFFPTTSTVQYTFGKVTRGDLVVSVAGSGQVSTLSKVTIKPNTTGQTQTLGQIISVRVQNGDYVKAGQIVAILDGKNTLQTLNQAKASVTSAQASYDKLVNGLTASDALTYNNAVTSAQTSLDNARQNILIKLRSAYTASANSVYISTDSFFSGTENTNPSLSISGINFINQELQNNIDMERHDIGLILEIWRTKVKNQTTSDDLVVSLNKAISDLNILRNYFDDMTTILNLYSVSSDSTGQTTISTDRDTAASARSSIDSSISDLTSTLQSYNGTVFSLQSAKDTLSLKQAPPTADDLAVSQANLDNAKANLANAETAYASRIITAPFDGQIGGLLAAVGQSVSSSDSLGTLITSDKVINVTLNEIDAAKVAAGNPVTISFDSLPGITLTGKLSYIDPLGTVSQGVVSYAVQISIDTQNDQIKTGMTATVSIVTTQHSNTLVVPTSAITTNGGKKYVLVANITSSSSQMFGKNFDNASSTRNMGTSTRQFKNSSSTYTFSSTTTQYPVVSAEIITGISNNTTTEVLSGLSEGQLIVTKKSTVNSGAAVKSTASAATTNTRGGLGGGF